MLIAAIINFPQTMEEKHNSDNIDWEVKLRKHITVAKLIIYVHNRSLTTFTQEWFP